MTKLLGVRDRDGRSIRAAPPPRCGGDELPVTEVQEGLGGPGDPEEVAEPGDPGEVAEPGDPGEVAEPGDPGEVAEPGDPEEVAEPEVLAPHQELGLSLRKARYGVAYLRAVCAQAGVKMVETSPDEDVSGVDCLLSYPEIETRVQVKCTAKRLAPTTGTLSYHIGEGVFRKWRRNQNRTYVIVVVVPAESDAWVDYDVNDETSAHCAAYWAEVDRGRTQGPWTVQIERGRRLTPETLIDWHTLEVEDTYGA